MKSKKGTNRKVKILIAEDSPTQAAQLAHLLEERIMAVADVVEAMSSHRPYRPGLGIDNALAEIGRGRGTSYDAAVADACLHLFGEKGYAVPA